MSECVGHYLGRLQPKTRPVTESILNSFFSYVGESGGGFKGMSPDQVLAYQNEHKNYEILDLMQRWIKTKDHLRAKTKQRYYTAVTSLFSHNRVFLPPDPAYHVPKAENGPVKNQLTVDEIIQLIQASAPLYRAVITCMAQGFMGANELVYWSDHGYDSLVEQLDGGGHPIKVDIPIGRKHNPKPFYTYLGKDAITELRRYFEVRPDTDEAIFITRFKTPLSEDTLRKYWNFKIKQLGIVTPRTGEDHPRAIRYGKSAHRVRHAMRSRWRLTGCDQEVCEYFMGHNLDRYGYDKSPMHYPEWFREQYMKAEPWLNILSQDPEKIPRTKYEDTLKRLQRELEEAKRAKSDEVQELREMFLAVLNNPEALEETRRRLAATPSS